VDMVVPRRELRDAVAKIIRLHLDATAQRRPRQAEESAVPAFAAAG
jgi:acetyl-CoA carboxylase beta subunit